MSTRPLLICVLFASACTVGEAEEDAVTGDGLTDELHVDDTGVSPDASTGIIEARVCAAGTTVKGIDVSKWESSINWTSVKNGGYAFAFIRVSDGTTSPDAKFAGYWAGAKAAGVIRGAYQFFRPSQNVTTQANMMINAIGTYRPGDLPPVIDVEATGSLSPATVASKVRQWVDKVYAAVGVRPIVYTGKYFWRDQVGGPSSFAPNPLWIAQYTTLCPDLPSPWTKWTFWQYTDTGSVPGISGHVDTNRFNGSLADLRAFAHTP
jgi:lysozyme